MATRTLSERTQRKRLLEAWREAAWTLSCAEHVFHKVPVQYIGGEELQEILELRKIANEAREAWISSEFVPLKHGTRVMVNNECSTPYDDPPMPLGLLGTVQNLYTAGTNAKGRVTQAVRGDDGVLYWIRKKDLVCVDVFSLKDATKGR